MNICRPGYLILNTELIEQGITYPEKPPPTSETELVTAFFNLVATVRENWILVTVVVVLYIYWRRRRTR